MLGSMATPWSLGLSSLTVSLRKWHYVALELQSLSDHIRGSKLCIKMSNVCFSWAVPFGSHHPTYFVTPSPRTFHNGTHSPLHSFHDRAFSFPLPARAPSLCRRHRPSTRPFRCRPSDPACSAGPTDAARTSAAPTHPTPPTLSNWSPSPPAPPTPLRLAPRAAAAAVVVVVVAPRPTTRRRRPTLRLRAGCPARRRRAGRACRLRWCRWQSGADRGPGPGRSCRRAGRACSGWRTCACVAGRRRYLRRGAWRAVVPRRRSGLRPGLGASWLLGCWGL